MNIRTRLSISFSILVSGIFLLFGLLIYLLAADHRLKDFQERLNQRVLITENVFLEKDSFSGEAFEKITNAFLQTLPEETEEVIELKGENTQKFQYEYPPTVQRGLLTNEVFAFREGDTQGASRVFRVKEKDYLVIVTAVDKIGIENLSFLKSSIAILIAIAIPIIFLSSYFISKRMLLPISKKIDKANKISATNLHMRLNVYNPKDEIGKLAIAFNNLLDRLEESFEAQIAFISNASHEIKNPLTAIMGEAEVAISRSRSADEYLESLKTVLEETEVLNSTINNLLQLSKVNAIEEGALFEDIHLDQLINAAKETYDFVNPENRILLNFINGSESNTTLISGNRHLLKTTIINLLDNACKFSNNNEVRVGLKASTEQIKLSIADKGIGIASADLDKIRTPFFRGNNAIKIKGSGIGLALCERIIDLHKANLEFKSKIDSGTEVSITFPKNLP